MESEPSSRTLPDELVERIVTMMPFPSIFRARVLSKAWLARFSSIASLDDEEGKRRASSFQKQVRERSENWGIFFPVFIDEEFSCAYDWASRNWIRLPSLSFLPNVSQTMSNLFVKGAVLGDPSRMFYQSTGTFYVANIFTRSWKKLPPLPGSKDSSFSSPILLSNTSSGTYKVIGLYGEGGRLDKWSTYIYESKTDAWSIKNLATEFVRHLGRPVYFKGVLYMVAAFDGRRLLTLDVEEGTSGEVRLGFNDIVNTNNADLVVCNAELLMIAKEEPSTVRVLRIDLGTGQLKELTTGPPACLKDRLSRKPSMDVGVSHGNYIFFFEKLVRSITLAYNVHQDEWSYFDFTPEPMRHGRYDGFRLIDSFQPGLNPFWAV